MSMVCWARKPGGVFMLIIACGVTDDAVEQPQSRAPTAAAAASSAAARLALFRVGPGNVQHNLELQQRRSGRHRIRAVPGVSVDGRAGRPRLERLFGLPLRDHEVAILTLDGPQQLKAEETRGVLNGVRSVGESLLQFV